jgi:hypothetical protein
MNRILSAGVLALTAAGLLAAVPAAQAVGPNTCIYNPVSKNVGVKVNPAGGGSLTQLVREGNKIVTFDNFGKTVCMSTTGTVATVFNTAAIVVNGSLSSSEDFIIDFSGGDFAPGAPSSNGDQTRAEITAFTDSSDIVDVVGSDAGDIINVTGGSGTGKLGSVLFNGNLNDPSKMSLRMNFDNPGLLRINGKGGPDFITGGGPFFSATTMLLRLTGGPGDDHLVGGLLGGDVLLGEGGDDSFTTDEGQRDDISNGGDGNDRAFIDSPGDSAFSVETINGSIGKPVLTHTALKHGTSTVNVAWTHPQAWKRLAKVELGAFLGTKRVGTVTMTPATGKIAAHGAVSLTNDAMLAHEGKTVSTKLALKLAKSLDAGKLHLELSATDKEGHVQTDQFPGLA